MAHKRQSTSSMVLKVGLRLSGEDVTVTVRRPEGDFVTDLTCRKEQEVVEVQENKTVRQQVSH